MIKPTFQLFVNFGLSQASISIAHALSAHQLCKKRERTNSFVSPSKKVVKKWLSSDETQKEFASTTFYLKKSLTCFKEVPFSQNICFSSIFCLILFYTGYINIQIEQLCIRNSTWCITHYICSFPVLRECNYFTDIFFTSKQHNKTI